MKKFDIIFKKEKPLYIELYDYIKEAIIHKELKPNEKKK